MPSLVTLRKKSRFLKLVDISPKDLREDEATRAEVFADNYIEGMLGITFTSPNIPEMIVEIADRIASAQAFEYTHGENSPKKSEKAEALMKKADELLNKILDGKLGLMFSDGSFHPKYPGISKSVKENQETDHVEIIF